MSFHKYARGSDLHAPSQELVHNDTGSPIAALKCVKMLSYGTSYPQITVADGTTETANAVTIQSIAAGGTGFVSVVGLVTGVDTNAWAPGTELYADANGDLVAAGGGPQIVATVLKQHATLGVIYVIALASKTAGGGEANTASNLGSGTGLFAQKTGSDLQFKSLTATNGVVTFTENMAGTEIDVDIDQSAIDHDQLTNTHMTIPSPGAGDAGKVFVATGADTGEWATALRSTGAQATPGYTDNGGGSITISAVDAVLHSDAAFVNPARKYTLPQITATLTDGVMNYVVGDYNSGSPIMKVITDVSLINESNVIPLLSIFRDGNELEVQNWDSLARGLVNKLHQSIVKTQRYRRESGLSLTTYGTRNVRLSSGVVWVAAVKYALDEVASATSPMKYFQRTGGAWVASDVTQYNNTQYSDGTNTQTLSNNRFAVNWIYRSITDAEDLYLVLGTGDYTLIEAQASQPPANLPARITSHTMLVGRIIVEKSASTATAVQSAFDQTFVQAAASVHNDLSGIQGGTTGEYYHLTSDQKDRVASLPTVYDDTKEQTGFVDPSNVGVAYDSSARTITLTHASGYIDYYYRGVKKQLTSPWTSTAHTNSTGHYYWLYINGSGVGTWLEDTFPGFTNVLVAYCYYGASTKFAIREPHGLMQWQSHKELHESIGTYRVSGGLVTAGTFALNTNSVAAVTPGVDSAIVADEDLESTIASLADGGPYTRLHFDSGLAVFNTSSTFPYPDNGTDIQYNMSPNSGTALAAMTISNRYVNVYGILVPTTSDATSQAYRILWMIGQQVYTTSAAAAGEDFRTLTLGNLSTLFTEFVPFIRLTFVRTNSNNTKNAQLAINPTYLLGNKLNLSSVAGFAGTDHNTLTGRTDVDSHPGSAISTDTTNFGGVLTTSEDTVQKALDKLDDNAQPKDATLTALAGLNSTGGLVTQTAEDTFTKRTLTGGGGVTVTDGDGVSGNPTLGVSALQSLWVPAGAMRPSSTGGCAPLSLIASAANQPDISTLNFDASTQEHCQFWTMFPKGWNEGTLTAKFVWSHGGTATNFAVVWGIQAVAIDNDGTIKSNYSDPPITVTDSGGTTDNLYVSPETSALTVAGSPTAGKLTAFRVFRKAADGSDTLAIDARLHGVQIFWTRDTLTDA